jgi:hypothetical protein
MIQVSFLFSAERLRENDFENLLFSLCFPTLRRKRKRKALPRDVKLYDG